MTELAQPAPLLTESRAGHSAATTQALHRAADKLEAQFLAEMLRQAGFDDERGQFGGGIGEAQFTSLLREAQAEAIVKAGGIGLAEHLFRALQERANG
ncbi:chemotaxis protein chel [Thioclava sp. BHET1]|nr:chemotaxis protein chel [Thioclava sp. BHET1]